MISNKQTADVVRDIVLRNPFLIDYLQRDLLNVAQLARELLPRVRTQNPKATVESIAVAISRLEVGKANASKDLTSIVRNVQFSVRTNIALVKLRRGTKLPGIGGDDVLFIHQHPEFTSIITDEKNLALVTGRTLERMTGLGLLTIKDTQADKPVNYRVTPGFITIFLSNISKEGINIIDIFTGLDSVNVVLKEQDLMTGFAICGAVKKNV